MSEFYLYYFEINKNKNQILHTRNELERMEKRFKSVASRLSGQRGLGIEKIKSQINTLARKTGNTADDLEQIGIFLKDLIKQTEAADKKAAKILKNYSLKKTENIFQNIRTFLKYFMTIVLSLIGGIVSGNPTAKWVVDIWKAGNSASDQNSSEGILRQVLKSLGKTILGPGTKQVAGTIGGSAVAGWAVDLVEDIYDNFADGKGTVGDDVMESIAEALAGAGLYGTAGLIAAGIVAALGIASGGLAAGAIAAGTTIAVKWLADAISNAIYNNNEGFVENAGDSLCNWREQALGW